MFGFKFDMARVSFFSFTSSRSSVEVDVLLSNGVFVDDNSCGLFFDEFFMNVIFIGLGRGMFLRLKFSRYDFGGVVEASYASFSCVFVIIIIIFVCIVVIFVCMVIILVLLFLFDFFLMFKFIFM